MHAGPVDTDMASELTLPKVTPADVVRQTLNAIESGRHEVLTDNDPTGQGWTIGVYLDFDPDRAVLAGR